MWSHPYFPEPLNISHPLQLGAPFTSHQTLQPFLEGMNSSQLFSREPSLFREKPQDKEIWEGRERERDQAAFEAAAKQLGDLSIGLCF